MNDPVVPEYGRSTLAELLPSVGSHLGGPGTDVFTLPASQRYVVLLIDGLGAEQLSAHAELAPYLSSLSGLSLTGVGPSTTASSITSFGTGLAPGAHGVAGYSFWYSPLGEVVSSLRWKSELDPFEIQPQLTYFERLSKTPVRASAVAPAPFANSGLTNLALRGATFLPVNDESDAEQRAELVAIGAEGDGPSLTYCYERILDHTGHGHGVDSDRWRQALTWVDGMARTIRARLDDGVRLLITADHGMIDIPAQDRILIEDDPLLNADIEAVAGEARLRHLKVRPGCDREVAERWRDRLGESAWVVTRNEADEAGWFGPISRRFADRFGDVIVAMSAPMALTSRSFPGEFRLTGMHGSLTAAEVKVPLLID